MKLKYQGFLVFTGLLMIGATGQKSFGASGAVDPILQGTESACKIYVATIRGRHSSGYDSAAASNVETLKFQTLKNRLAVPAVELLNRAVSSIKPDTLELIKVYKDAEASGRSSVANDLRRKINELLKRDLLPFLGENPLKQASYCNPRSGRTDAGYWKGDTLELKGDQCEGTFIRYREYWFDTSEKKSRPADRFATESVILTLDTQDWRVPAKLTVSTHTQFKPDPEGNYRSGNGQYVAGVEFSLLEKKVYTVQSSELGASDKRAKTVADAVVNDSELPAVCRNSPATKELFKAEMVALEKAKPDLEPALFAREEGILRAKIGSTSGAAR